MAATPELDLPHAIYGVIEKLRWVLLAHSLVLAVLRWERVDHPVGMLLANLVMLVWTPLAGRWQTRPGGPTREVVLADLAVAAVLLAGSRWVLGAAELGATEVPLPGFWIMAAPLAAAVWGGARWGLGTAALLVAVKLVQGTTPDARSVGSMGVLALMSWGLGAIVDALRASLADREANHARAAALAERDRMNRIVHDGALQVLALVEREGPELGPKGLYLANVARQQEARLRALLQDRHVELPTELPEQQGIDIASLLEQHDSETVTVSVMAGEVVMETRRANELNAAVSEVLANVARHAGPAARAWVLLEEEQGQIIVSVRDNGHGMTRREVVQATTSGRLGIQNSILGRIADIGGVAVARSLPGRGVEWEFRVPVEEER